MRTGGERQPYETRVFTLITAFLLIERCDLKRRVDMVDHPDKIFAEAERLNAQGELSQARQLLEQAAANGHLPAAYRLAISESAGIGGPVDTEAAMARLKAIHQDYAPARMFLSVATASGWAGSESWPDAVALHIKYAKAGDPAAMFDLGLLCLMRSPNEFYGAAHALFASALNTGAIYAIPALMRLHAVKGERFLAPSHHLEALAKAQYMPIARIDKLAHAQSQQASAPPGLTDWSVLETALGDAPETWKDVPGAALSAPIHAEIWQSEIHPCICDYLTGFAGPNFAPAQIYDSDTGQPINHPVRRALQAGLKTYRQTLAIHAVERILAHKTELPWKNAERLNVLLYRPGDYYAPHADYFSETAKEDVARLNEAGQRAATALLSLHAAPKGGATHFPHVKATWTGQTGDILRFRNLDSKGAPNPISLHEGQVVEEGWKALASLWVRSLTYRTEA